LTDSDDRNRAIFRERSEGMTFRAIAERHGISLQRARSIFVRECHRQGILDTASRERPG
jgi:hypothetical protein